MKPPLLSQQRRARQSIVEPSRTSLSSEAVEAAPFAAWAQRELGNQELLASLRGEGGAFGASIAARTTSEVAGFATEAGPPSNSAMLAAMRAAAGRHEDTVTVQPLVAQSSGSPLPSAVAARMGAVLGHGVSHVMVHTDNSAQQAAEALNAHAFALGADLFFGPGTYAPGTQSGDALLLHELQHVVQYDEGRLPDARDGAVSSPSDPAEREADAVAREAMVALQAGETPVAAPAAESAESAGPGPAMRSALGDAVGAVTEAVAGSASSGLIEAVRLVSPALAELLEGGIGGFAEEALSDALEAFVSEMLSDIDLSVLVEGLLDEVRGLFATIEGVLSGDPCCCATFDGWMQTLSYVLVQLNDNPLAVALREGFSAFGGLVNDLLALLVGAELSALLSAFSGAKAVFDGYFALVTAGQDAVKGLADWVWDGVCGLLGIDAAEGNIVDVVTQMASDWLLGAVTEQGPGLFEAWQQVASFGLKLNPLMWMYELLGVFKAMWEAGSFLWSNWGSPTMARDAAQTSAMAQTFISAFGAAAEAMGAVSSEMSGLFQGMLEQSEANADAVGMGWLFRGSQALLSVMMLPGQLGLDFAGWLMDGGTATLSSFASAVWEYFHPLMEVLTSLTLAVTNPGLIPLILGGWAWRLLPDCLKPPIVDLLLDVVIDALAAMPELPGLLQLSGVLIAGLRGALSAFRSRSDAEKIAITDKVAQLLTGSPEFALGFVVGLFGGMLDGILDPLMLIWMVIEGLVWLVDSAGGLMASMSGGGEAAAGAATDASAAAEQAITLMPEAASAASDAAASPMSNPEVVATLASAGERIQPPAEVIGETFVPAFEEAFSGEGKSSVADLAAMVGSLWETMVSLAEQAGAWLGNQLCEAMLTSDVGYSLGYGVGYITGAILWEVILGFLTGGMWEVLGPTSRAIVKFLDLGGELFGAAFHLLGELGSMLMKAIGPLLDWVGSTGLMRTLKEAFVTLADELVGLSDELLSLLGNGSQGAVRKADGLADEGAGLADEVAEGGTGTARRAAVVAGEDAKLALAAQRIRPEPGVFDVVVHGDGSSLLVLERGAWRELSPAELAAHMKANGFEGGSVRLVSCGTGQADGAASKLARELGVDVKAPTDTVWIHPDGTLTVGPTPDATSGGWSRSSPDGASEVVEDSARLGDEALKRVDEAVAAGEPNRVWRDFGPDEQAHISKGDFSNPTDKSPGNHRGGGHGMENIDASVFG